VKRHAGKCLSTEDIEDWTQDLCAHMSSLPATSKYRNSGKRDVIQRFDPFRHHGASLPRFLNYVNRCLANKFQTIHACHMKDPIRHAEALSFSEITEEESAGEKLHRALLEKLIAIDFSSLKQADDKVLLAEFVDFVRTQNPPLLPVLGTMIGTRTEAAQKLRATGTEVGRLYRQIRELGRSFLSRRRPKPRKHSLVERYDATKARASTTDLVPPPVRHSADLNVTYWNRVELYKEVWSHPLVKLSRKYRISDVRLGKVCRRLKIPHPGRGYWAKRAVGQHVAQVPLSEFPDAPLVRRLIKAKQRSVQFGTIEARKRVAFWP
jgi:hypothetical protein